MGAQEQVPAATPYVACFVFNAGSSNAYVDGSASSGYVIGSAPTGTNIAIGSGPGLASFNGNIGRLVLLGGALTAADVGTLTTAMRSEFTF